MNTPPPIEAVKGKDLNDLADKYFKDGVQEGDYAVQLQELLYLYQMATDNELRLAFDEWGMMYGMIRVCREQLAKVNQRVDETNSAVSHLIR